jgi:L-gulonolactone oxidase
MRRLVGLHAGLLGWSLLQSLAGFAAVTPGTRERDLYEQALGEVNAEVSRVARAACPGVDLVVSCGNRQCERSLGEDEKNCAADCVQATIRSYNQQTLCHEVQSHLTPSSREEVQQAVQAAIQAGRRVRVVGRLHSANGILCNRDVVLSTERFNQVRGIETLGGVETVAVDPGITMAELMEWLHERGKSLGFPVMGFRGVSIAGAIATGSHGSSPKHSAILSSAVEAIELVDGRGNFVRVDASQAGPNGDRLKAARAHLGMLGAVTRVWLRIRPQFNLAVQVTEEKDEKLVGPGALLGQVEGCDYGQLNWFPGTGRFIRTCGRMTDRAADPGAQNVLLDPTVSEVFVKPVKKVLQYGACHPRLNCLLEKFRYATFLFQPPFEVADGPISEGKTRRVKEATGPAHRMMSSVLTRHQDGFFQMDWELVVPASRAQAAIEAVKAYAEEAKICLPLVGVFIRFAPAEEATLLAHTVARGEFKAGEPAVFIEMPVYLPTAFPPEMAAAYDRKYEDFARLLIEKFSGRAHWGKNRDWVFGLQTERGLYGENLERFRKVQLELDPHGVFSNDFTLQAGLGAKSTRSR